MFYLFDCIVLLMSVLKWLFITYVCFHIYFGTFVNVIAVLGIFKCVVCPVLSWRSVHTAGG